MFFPPLSSFGLNLEKPGVSSDCRCHNVLDGHKATVSFCQLFIASGQHCRVPQIQQHPSFLLSFHLSSAWKEVTPKPMGSDAPPALQNYHPRQPCAALPSDSPRTKSVINKGHYNYSRLSHTSFSHTGILKKISGISTQEQGFTCYKRD